MLRGALPPRWQWRGGPGARRAGASNGYPEPRVTSRTELFPLQLHGFIKSVGDFRNEGVALEENTSFELATPSFGSGPARRQQPGATFKSDNMARKFYGLCRAPADTKKLIIYSNLVYYKGKTCPSWM